MSTTDNCPWGAAALSILSHFRDEWLLERLFDCLFYAWILSVSIGLWNYPAPHGIPGRMTSLQLGGEDL